MLQPTIEKLKEMRLGVLARALQQQQESGGYHRMSFEERLGLLVDEEYAARESRKITRSLKAAKLHQSASVDEVDLESRRNLDRTHLLELSHCNWISRGQSVIITGPTGVGKTFVGCALAERACHKKYSVRYWRLDDLVRQATYAQADGSYPRFMQQLLKIKLLVIDEWLRTPVSSEHARILADVLDDRYRKLSTLIVSQYAVKDWYQRFEDVTVGEAILDRLVHDARRIELKGESMRKKTAEQESQA